MAPGLGVFSWGGLMLEKIVVAMIAGLGVAYIMRKLDDMGDLDQFERMAGSGSDEQSTETMV